MPFKGGLNFINVIVFIVFFLPEITKVFLKTYESIGVKFVS